VDSEQESFEAYVRARTAVLTRVAYLLTGDHHRAEDLLQQALVRVAARWRKVVAGGDPDGYVRRVLYTQHVSWWRRIRLTEVDGQPPEGSVADHSDRVTVELTVRAALDRLAPRQRAVLVLRYFEDLTEVQTAEVLGCRVGTVKSQARDGLARLRAEAPDLATLLEVDA